MNKKGERNVSLILSMVAGVLVAFMLVVIVHRVSSQHAAEHTFYAMDSGMLIDAMLSAPGDVEIMYNHEFFGGYAMLNKSEFSIFASVPQPNQSSPYRQSFLPRSDINISEDEMKLSVLYFIKKGDKIMINNYLNLGLELNSQSNN